MSASWLDDLASFLRYLSGNETAQQEEKESALDGCTDICTNIEG